MRAGHGPGDGQAEAAAAGVAGREPRRRGGTCRRSARARPPAAPPGRRRRRRRGRGRRRPAATAARRPRSRRGRARSRAGCAPAGAARRASPTHGAADTAAVSTVTPSAARARAASSSTTSSRSIGAAGAGAAPVVAAARNSRSRTSALHRRWCRRAGRAASGRVSALAGWAQRDLELGALAASGLCRSWEASATKLALPGAGGLEPPEHPVHRGGQAADLVVDPRRRAPAGAARSSVIASTSARIRSTRRSARPSTSQVAASERAAQHEGYADAAGAGAGSGGGLVHRLQAGADVRASPGRPAVGPVTAQSR